MLKYPIVKNAQNLTWPRFFLFKNCKLFVEPKPSAAISWNMTMHISVVNLCDMEKIKNSKIEKKTS